MGIRLTPVTNDNDFTVIARRCRESFENPDSRMIELFNPLPSRNPTPEQREATIQAGTLNLVAQFHADSTITWIQVVDDEKNELLGAAMWHIFEQNPYAEPHVSELTWFEEGETRKFATELMTQHATPRMTYMQKPHVHLSICFAIPAARGRGVGKALVQWGVDEADKRGLPAYLDATDAGVPVYKRFGFIEHTPREFTLPDIRDKELSQRLEEQLMPFTWWPMFRPVGGEFVKGQTMLPWQN